MYGRRVVDGNGEFREARPLERKSESYGKQIHAEQQASSAAPHAPPDGTPLALRRASPVSTRMLLHNARTHMDRTIR